MSEDPEPAENVSGGVDGGGTTASFQPAASPATRAEAVVDRLGELYWTKTYGGRPSSVWSGRSSRRTPPTRPPSPPTTR